MNGILGRGRSVVAEITIPRAVCQEYLHTTPEKIADINTKKNLLGSILAGSLRSANAHYANMLLAFYLATGQDAANIVEGSQGITYAEVKEDCLKLSCTIPNIIIGSVGNGKNAPYAEENLALLGCLEKRDAGANGDRLAAIAAAYDFLFAETNRITVAGTFNSNSFTNDQFIVGMEYGWKEMFLIRAGYTYEKGIWSKEGIMYDDNCMNINRGLSAGVSIQVPLSKKEDGMKFAVDYSYRDTYTFNGTHSVGARIIF